MASLVHCIYTSRESHHLSTAEIDTLLRHSRESNGRRGVTGILLHVEGCFMQILEGEPHIIDELYAKILIDPRHTAITRIILEAIPRRFFGEWTMGLSTLSADELAEVLDFHNPEKSETLLAFIDEGRAKKLLRAFSEGRWRQRVTAASNSVAA